MFHGRIFDVSQTTFGTRETTVSTVSTVSTEGFGAGSVLHVCVYVYERVCADVLGGIFVLLRSVFLSASVFLRAG